MDPRPSEHDLSVKPPITDEEWNDETTTTYRPALMRAGASSLDGRDLDEIFERAVQDRERFSTDFIFNLYLQAASELADTNAQVASRPRPKLAVGRLGPERIFVLSDGQVKIDWADDAPPPRHDRSYRSPEHERGLPIDVRSDIFSLSLAVAELFIGKRLSNGAPSILESDGGPDFVARLQEGRRIPRELGQILLKALAVEVERRYADPFLLLDDLHKVKHKLGFRTEPSALGEVLLRLFPAPPPPPPPAEPSEPELIVEEISSPSASAAPPLEPAPAPVADSPPPLPDAHVPASDIPAYLAESTYAEFEAFPSLSRTLPPVQPKNTESSSGRGRSRTTALALNVGVGLAVLALSVLMFWKTGEGTVYIAVAGHVGQPLTDVMTVADGVHKCYGPRCTFHLAPGMHEVNTQAEGYVPQLQLVIVRSKEQAALNFRLERAVGFLKVAGQPPGVSLSIDGLRMGKLPQELDVPTGPHRLRFEAAGFVPEEYQLDFAPGQTRNLGEIALRPASGATLESSSAGASSEEQPHGVASGEAPAPLAKPVAGSCWVSFNSIPVSNVVLDGANLGTTPLLRTRVRPGAHTAQFSTGDKKQAKQFACRAGTSKVVSLIFAP
jgi:hypothetical protein